MERHAMRFCQPATRWEDALPSGNGTTGVLVHGKLAHEVIIVNHEALWIHHEKPVPPDISEHVPELREMIVNEEWVHLDKFLDIMLVDAGYPHALKPDHYHPAFDILVDMEPGAPCTAYTRSMNPRTGIVSVTWNEGSVGLARDCFVSRADDVACLRITSTGAPLSCTISLQKHGIEEEQRHFKGSTVSWDDIPITFERVVDGSWLRITGRRAGGVLYHGVARVVAPGGVIEVHHGGVRISGATEITVLVKVLPHDDAGDGISRLERELEALPGDFDVLLARHLPLHREPFDRVALDLHVPLEDRDKSCEALLLDASCGTIPDVLVEHMFDLGRYLLLSSSRPGGWPANLQGIWNGYYHPAWSSDYHNDENVQMCYWGALPGNLAETTLPYFDFYEACIPDCRRNARAVFGCRGILAPIAQTVRGEAPLYTGPWLNWTAGAGWLAQLFHEYWLFTRDNEFLQGRAVPYMVEVATFYEDFLIEDATGKLCFSPSLSPENIPGVPDGSLVTVNATMDVAIAREVLSNLVAACQHLGMHGDRLPRWREVLSKLPAYEVNEAGAIKEWIHPSLNDNSAHRHLSHLYPLFPGHEITGNTSPALFEACRVAVEKRAVIGQESQSGWSLVHAACVHARLGQGDEALERLELLVRSCVGPNLFTYHNDWRDMGLTVRWDFIDRIFQIDANMGFPAAVMELLVGSNKTMIMVLPARPTRWKTGSISGVRTRTGATVSVSWDADAGRVVLDVDANVTGSITTVLPSTITTTTVTSGTCTVAPAGRENAVLLAMDKGDQATIQFDVDLSSS